MSSLMSNGILLRSLNDLKMVCSRRREGWKKLIEKSDLVESDTEFGVPATTTAATNPFHSAKNNANQGSPFGAASDDAATPPTSSIYATWSDRNEAAKWIHRQGAVLRLQPDTICLAFSHLDRIVANLKVKKCHMTVLAAACLSLATKFTDDQYREHFAKFLIKAGSLTFSFKDLRKMELLVCTKLDWHIAESTPLDFLYSLSELFRSRGKESQAIGDRTKNVIATFLASQLVDIKLAHFGSLEVALGCLEVVQGRQGCMWLKLLFKIHRIKVEWGQVVDVALKLRPHMGRLRIPPRTTSDTDGELYRSVKRLLSRGCLEPTPFGQKTFAEVVRC